MESHSKSTTGTAGGWDQIAAANQIIFEFLLGQAACDLVAARLEQVLDRCSVAAWFASGKGWSGELASSQMESLLLRVAQSLPAPVVRKSKPSKPVYLHVLTEAYDTLGHSNLCRRWIEFDSQNSHSVMLLSQRSERPKNLANAVARSGGQFRVLDPASPLLERARELRQFASECADAVVLHVHPDDVIATTAFGVAGGPPVLLVNHADHVFWPGCTIADIVLDIRPSGHAWTREARGVSRAAILPLPLEITGPSADAGERSRVRRQLGIPQHAPVFLTVGSAAKFRPLPELNFLQAAEKIISLCPGAFLLAVGPEDSGQWRVMRKSSGGRLIALGYQADSRLYCEAADVYLEGFPLGSLTALLEAGLAGLPCIRGPGACRPPFTSDDLSLEQFPQPADVDEYIKAAIRLAGDVQARQERGRRWQAAIEAHHCRPGWLERLRSLHDTLPKCHSLYPLPKPVAVDPSLRNWLLRFHHNNRSSVNPHEVAAEVLVEAWKRTGVPVRVEPELSKALQQGVGESPPDFLDRLNRDLEVKGSRAYRLWSAEAFLRSGRSQAARQLVWKEFRSSPSSALQPPWLKLCVKAHGGRGMLAAAAQVKTAARALGGIRKKLGF